MSSSASSWGGTPSEWWNVVKKPQYWFSTDTPSSISNKEQDAENAQQNSAAAAAKAIADQQAQQEADLAQLSEDERAKRLRRSQTLMTSGQGVLGTPNLMLKTLMGA